MHRDIKPANLLLDQQGQVRVLDLGIAKLVGSGTNEFQTVVTDQRATLIGGFTRIQLTQPGAVIGTLAFMSPEQRLARQIDHRTDIYSLGACWYFLLHAASPYEIQLAAGHEGSELQPLLLFPEKQAEFEPYERLFAAMTANSISDRPYSAEEVLNWLRDCDINVPTDYSKTNLSHRYVFPPPAIEKSADRNDQRTKPPGGKWSALRWGAAMLLLAILGLTWLWPRIPEGSDSKQVDDSDSRVYPCKPRNSPRPDHRQLNLPLSCRPTCQVVNQYHWPVHPDLNHQHSPRRSWNWTSPARAQVDKAASSHWTGSNTSRSY